MNDRERDELLARAHRTSGSLGRSLPETVTLDDEAIPVKAFYFEVQDRDRLEEADWARVEEVLSYLRRERLALVQRIENEEVDYETGEGLVETIGRLDRAVNAFESLDQPGYAEDVRRERIESAQELVDMLREFGKL